MNRESEEKGMDGQCYSLLTNHWLSRFKCKQVFSFARLQTCVRLSWRGCNARQIALGTILPVTMQFMLALIAAQNSWCTAVVFIILLISLYCYSVFQHVIPSTKFFLVWTLSSGVLLMMVFENYVVPMLEILPEENIALLAYVLIAIGCMYKARMQFIVHLSDDSVDENFGEEHHSGGCVEQSLCPICKRKMSFRTSHCSVCQVCVAERDYHCAWLDCCIGQINKRAFIIGVLFLIIALTYGANLTLTTVCHPFLIMDMFLLPDDCSDVYYDFDLALCFVCAIYCLLTAALLAVLLVRQCWMISLGITEQEWYELRRHERRWGGLFSNRPHSKGFIKNWLDFLWHTI